MEPQTIPDNSLPLLAGGFSQTTGSNSNPVTLDSGAETPNTNVDVKFPQAIIAQETLSQSLNTETKHILSEYTFESLGAFAVYSATHPLANIKVSGDGIVATDANGNTTFTLDGETGNATFAGEVKANSFVSGAVTVGNGKIIIDGAATQINLFDSGNHNTVRLDTNGLTIFNATGSTKAVGDSNGFTVYDLSSFRFYDSSIPGVVATLGADGAGNVAFTPTSAGIGLNIAAPFFIGGKRIMLSGDLNVQNGATTIGNDGFTVTITNNGLTKTAIVPFENEYKALYAIESPEVWFMDFCKSKDDIDPMFLAVTEGKMHFVALDSEIGYQVWRKRKGHSKTRFETKTKEEFLKNESFLQMSRVD